MSLPRKITIDTYARRDEGAYVVVFEHAGQAPIVLEAEGCDTSFNSCMDRVERMRGNGRAARWCIARLVPVDGNELLILDLERLQQFNKKDGDE
jgi:hypothetical protein